MPTPLDAETQPQAITTRYGEFFVSHSDDLISNALRHYGEWAQHEIDILCSLLHPGDQVVDAGAYIGTHARAFSQQVGSHGQVHAFEPVPATFALLQRNALVAPAGNIVPHNIGLASAAATCRLDQEAEHNNLASASMIKGHGQHFIEVRVIALDALALPRLDLLKVDVEGMEMALLEGAAGTIERCRPLIFLEVISLSASAAFLTWAEQNAYQAYGVNTAAYNADNFSRSAENLFGSAREAGLLLIDAQRSAHYQARLAQLGLPRLTSLDDLAALLLHKPQYVADILNKSQVAELLGTHYATPEQAQLVELQQLLAAKDTAQKEANLAYQALHQAYAEKDCELQRSHAAFAQEADALRLTYQQATQAYQDLRHAYDEKDRELQRSHAAFAQEADALRLAYQQATQAYQDLRHAYDEKDRELQRSHASFAQEADALHLAHQQATQAYQDLRHAYDEKEHELQHHAAAAQLATTTERTDTTPSGPGSPPA